MMIALRATATPLDLDQYYRLGFIFKPTESDPLVVGCIYKITPARKREKGQEGRYIRIDETIKANTFAGFLYLCSAVSRSGGTTYYRESFTVPQTLEYEWICVDGECFSPRFSEEARELKSDIFEEVSA